MIRPRGGDTSLYRNLRQNCGTFLLADAAQGRKEELRSIFNKIFNCGEHSKKVHLWLHLSLNSEWHLKATHFHCCSCGPKQEFEHFIMISGDICKPHLQFGTINSLTDATKQNSCFPHLNDSQKSKALILLVSEHGAALTVSHFAFIFSFSNLANSRLSWMIISSFQIRSSAKPMRTMPATTPATIGIISGPAGQSKTRQ